MSEIKVTIDIPQLDGLTAALEHIAKAMDSAVPTSAITQPAAKAAVEIKPDVQSSTKPEHTPVQAEDKHYTLEEVRAVFMNCAKKHGKEEVKKILAQLGASKVTELALEDYARAVKAVEEVK